MTDALLVTRDPTILDELHRLAAAAGAGVTVAGEASAALRAWATAPFVAVGVDLLPDLAAAAPPRRAGVRVVGCGPAALPAYVGALAVGAEAVLTLPADAEELVGALTDLDEAVGLRRVVGVVAGSGGAGATTVACALAEVAATTGPAVLVDLDPWGPGADRVLGLEARPGVRWDDLDRSAGRLGGRALRESLPRGRGPGVLTWGEGARSVPQPGAVREVLSAAGRGHRTVVVDLPRSGGGSTGEVLARCDLVLLVVRPTVTGVVAAARVAAGLGVGAGGRVVALVRGRGLTVADVEGVTGVPVLAVVPDRVRVAEEVDLGLGPVRSRRGPLWRGAASVLSSPVAAARARPDGVVA